MTDFNSDARYEAIRNRQNENRHREIIDPEPEGKLFNAIAAVTFVGFGILVGVSATKGYAAFKRAGNESVVNSIKCTICHSKQAAFQRYFEKIGSPQPEKMAAAVLATKKPRLMAAIAKVESNGNPDVKATGYKKRHDGAFQVNRNIWGAVSQDAVEQAIQAEMVLDEHRKDSKNLKAALNAYGGDKTKKRYAYNILKELEDVPR